MMKVKWCCFLVFWKCNFFFNIIPLYLAAAPLSLEIQGKAAILVNANTGAILYEKNAHQLHYPASTTKIATAAYALEFAKDRLQKGVIAPKDALGAVSEETKRRSNYTLPSYWLVHDASHIGLKAGEELTLKDLLYGMMVPSGDDAANVIASSLADNIPQFMDQLNSYLRKLGCKQTHFTNPHGLFHPEHVTTAFDLALLACHALKSPVFREIVSSTRYIRPKTNKQEAAVMVQTNRLLRKGKCYYPKAIGVKTGYIAKAQNTLVAAACDKERVLVAVILKCEEREQIFLDAIKLFETAFNQPKMERTLLNAGKTQYKCHLEGAAKPIETKLLERVAIQFYPAEEPELNAVLHWKKVKFPINEGDCVGEIIIKKANGKVYQTVPVLACGSVSSTWMHWLKNFWGKN